MIEEAPFGGAVNHGADKAQFLDGAAEFHRGGVGLCSGSAAKPAKRPGWLAIAFARKSLVSRAMSTPA